MVAARDRATGPARRERRAVPANCPGVRPSGVHLHRHTSPALLRDPPLPADRVRRPGEGGPGRDTPTRGSSGKSTA